MGSRRSGWRRSADGIEAHDVNRTDEKACDFSISSARVDQFVVSELQSERG